MSETGKSRAASLGFPGSRLTELEAENARLRSELADRDETVRQLRAAAVRESQIRLVADSLPVLISYVDAQSRYRFVNHAYEVWFGHDRAGMVGKTMSEVLGDAAYVKVRPWAEKALAGERVSYDALLPYRDAGPRHVHVDYVPDARNDGRVDGFFALVSDVSDTKRVEQSLRESESRFRAMADSAPAPIWVTNEVGIEFANQALCDFTGLSVEQLIGDTWKGLAHPDDVAAVEEKRASAWHGKEPYEFEARFRRHDGEWRWLRCTCNPRHVSGGFLGYVGLGIDITDTRRVVRELRESEARFRRIADSSPVIMWVTRPDRKRDFVNQAYLDFLGLPHPEAVDFDWRQLIHPDDGERIVAESIAGEASLKTFVLEARYRRADGEWRWLRSVSQPRFDADGEPNGFIGVAHDVTEMRRADEALRAETRLLETLNRVGTILSGELDLDRVIQTVTDAGVELSGAGFGAFFYNAIGESGESYSLYTISGVDRSEFEKFPMPRKTAVFAPTFEGIGPVRSDDITGDPRYGGSEPYRGMPEGHLPVRSYLAVPVVSRSGEVIGGLFFGHEEAGRFTSRHEQLLVGLAGQAAVAIDNARLFEAAGREIEQRSRAQEALRELNQTLEARIAAAIAERERAEEALRQSQKMEAVGQLTGGIAHDFNNLLTVITGNLDMIQRRLAPGTDERVMRAVNSALIGAERAATLTQRLLAFSRRQPLSPKPTDVNELVRGMSELLHRALGETVDVETAPAPGVWRVEVDPHQLENAILNIAVNARDAMPSGGRLTIETANADFAHDGRGEQGEPTSGEYVLIRMTDTGSGMDEEMLARACEPFFTTKEVGKGTGLGLSMVYGFVKQSGGYFRLESEVGRGTTASIYLPRLQACLTASEEERQAEDPQGGFNETILVCEDDPDVRAYTVEVLRELGYRVAEAEDGPTALRLLESSGDEIDLLFTDVVLPSGMTGAELARQARASRPGLKVLYTTGYARDAIVHDGRLDPGVELIAKPFAFAELAGRIREVLEQS